MYIKIKNKLELEDYVVELDRERRRQLTMIRGGTNKLRIETGRWISQQESKRVCLVCLCDKVEDEKHFLLVCCLYEQERAEMFQKRCEVDVAKEDEEHQIQILIGVGWRKKGKEIKAIVLDYMKKAYEIRKRYIK